MQSILSRRDRRVLRFFNKYGFKNVILTLYILNSNVSWETVIDLEQYFINKISPSLNVDLVAGGYEGYHKPMSQEARNRLIKIRGTSIYIYDYLTKSLNFKSD